MTLPTRYITWYKYTVRIYVHGTLHGTGILYVFIYTVHYMVQVHCTYLCTRYITWYRYNVRIYVHGTLHGTGTLYVFMYTIHYMVQVQCTYLFTRYITWYRYNVRIYLQYTFIHKYLQCVSKIITRWCQSLDFSFCKFDIISSSSSLIILSLFAELPTVDLNTL